MGNVWILGGYQSDFGHNLTRPTFVLHFTNAYEDGDEIVLDGFFQGEPEPADNGMGTKWQRAFRFLALDRMQARLHRWHETDAAASAIGL